jgi:glyoxylase-like metal-dependent hydrolase (beta-lactamase superfamily II)
LEIARGLHRIEAPLGNRYAALYLVVGDAASLLVDTGVDDSLDRVLLPYLECISLRPNAIRYAINTHADFDHVGGNRAVRAHLPAASLMCGEADRSLICDLDLMIRQRYGEFRDEHGYDEPESVQEYIRSVTHTVPVDVGLRGGEMIDLGNRTVEIVHVPGHTWGHLAVSDLATGSVLVGDAVLGDSVLTAEGAPAFPPTYRYLDSYRETIRRLHDLRPQRILTAHYPVYEGPAGIEFLDLSLEYTHRVEQVVTSTLRDAHAPMTLLEIVAASQSRLGPWDDQSAKLLVYPVLGHLEVLARHGVVAQRRDEQSGRATFALSSASADRR